MIYVHLKAAWNYAQKKKEKTFVHTTVTDTFKALFLSFLFSVNRLMLFSL